MTKEEAREALDVAAQEYATAVFAEDGGIGLAKWVLVLHVDILDTNESGYTQTVSDGLAIHEQVGLLAYAQAHADEQVRAFGE